MFHSSRWPRAMLLITAAAWTLAGCGGHDGERSGSPSAARGGDSLADAAGTGGRCGGEPTPAQVEGPFFSDGAPRKSDLARDVGDEGTVAIVSGTVFGADCAPRPGLRVDFWQTDANGDYDNDGYRLRGYQLTDRDGSYRFRTILPGEYSGRTEHIHVKVRDGIDGADLLTTQLYVPGLSSAEEDVGIYDEENLLTVVDDESSPRRYRFDFILP